MLVRSRYLLTAALVAVCGIAFASAQNSDAIPEARIVQKIDASARVTLRGNTHPLAQPQLDRGLVPQSMPANRLMLVLARSARQEAELQTYLESLQDANSANFHQFLSPADFGKRFGVSDADLAKVQGWLTNSGFQVNRVSPSRMFIEFSGTAAQVQSAFGTELHHYVVNGRDHWANATDPQIPAALAPVVAGLASLNNFAPEAQFMRGQSARFDPQTHAIRPAYTQGNSSSGYSIWLGPADAATIYNTPTALNANAPGTLTGNGVTIGIVGDSNINTAQNDNYRATFGLAPKTTTVIVDGADPGENGDAIEAYLDTEVAAGIAPAAKVILYTSAGDSFAYGLDLAIQRAIDDNVADILNVSFGACEQALGTSGNQFYLNAWEQAAAQGIAVTVSTGDSGSAGCDNPNTSTIASKGLAVNGLASTPYNVAVGGTDYDVLAKSFSQYVDTTNTLPNHRSAKGYIPENPWNDSAYPNTTIANDAPLSATTGQTSSDNIVAGGGGISTIYTRPAWQSGFGSSTTRSLPDVSFLAGNGLYGATWGLCTDLDTDGHGNAIIDCAAGASGNSFNLTGVGGTSAAAPAFAGMLALVQEKVGSRLGQANSVLYALARSHYASVFHDVTTGNNSVHCVTGSVNCQVQTSLYSFLSGYDAGTSYDMATGLGSVNVAQLATNWSSVGLNPTTSALTLNGSTGALTLTHGAAVTASVNVSGSGGTPSGDVSLVDTATQTSSHGLGFLKLSGGAASASTNTLPGGTYSVSAHYAGDSTFAQSDSNAISVTVAPEASTTALTVVGFYNPTTLQKSSSPAYGYYAVIDAQPQSSASSSAGAPATGTVSFSSDSLSLGSAAIGADGVAELQTTYLPAGTHALTAQYAGDASYTKSTSTPTSQTLPQAQTTLAAPNVSPYDAYAGMPVTLSTKITANSAGAAPTGTVTFMNGTTTLGTAPVVGSAGQGSALASGTATFVTSSLPAGSMTVTAVYAGDANYAGSSATGQQVSVSKQLLSDLTIATNPASVVSNQPFNILVTAVGVSGDAVPGGTVTLTYSSAAASNSLTQTLAAGATTFAIPASAAVAGTLYVNVSYSGDANYQSMNVFNQTISIVASGTTTPAVTVTPSVSTVSSYPFTCNITVKGPNANSPAPTGMISISIAYWYGTYELVNGSATATFTGPFPSGKDAITVQYNGDQNYASASGTSSVFVKAIPQPTFTPNNGSTAANLPFHLSVLMNNSINMVTTGTVTLSGGNYAETETLSNGATTFTVPANTFATGQQTLTFTYSGDDHFNASSELYNLTVAAASTSASVPTISFSPAVPFVAVDQSMTLTTTVTAASGQSLPSGTITLNDGIQTRQSPLTNGVASFVLFGNSYSVGTQTLTATYSGDNNFAPNSATSTLTVLPSFTLASSAISAGSIQAGASATATITIAPVSGFTGNVALTASVTGPAGAVNLPTVSFNPGTISGGTGTSTLTISTKAATTAMHSRPALPWYGGGAVLACLFTLGLRRERKILRTFAVLCVLLAVSGIASCGGANSGGSGNNGGGSTPTPGTTTGSYSITVTATTTGTTPVSKTCLYNLYVQ